jgi:hypothetical protein
MTMLKCFLQQVYSRQYENMQTAEEKLNKTDAKLETAPRKLLA